MRLVMPFAGIRRYIGSPSPEWELRVPPHRSILVALLVVTVGGVAFDQIAPVLSEERPRDEDGNHTAAGPEGVALQVALDNAGFSPGIIDGIVGPKTRTSVAAFQSFVILPVTGKLDAATRRALDVQPARALRRYVITRADAEEVGACPDDWYARSKLKRLPFRSLEALVAERGHCTKQLLRRLNRGVRFDKLRAGTALLIPNVATPDALPTAQRVDVDLDRKLVRVIGGDGRVASQFHCSIPRYERDRPTKNCRVANVTIDPTYLFDPEKWPEVDNVHHRLVIPPGPRNPVGRCWIGLSLDGYGIHGTPEPELIGKTGSHGCIRLTNWDVLRLAKMVQAGTPVHFVSDGSLARRQ